MRSLAHSLFWCSVPIYVHLEYRIFHYLLTWMLRVLASWRLLWLVVSYS